jgi:hypothetical protein
MITTFRYDFRKIKKDTYFEFRYQWHDDDGNALSLAGSTVKCIIWNRERTSQLVELGYELLNENPGITKHFLTRNQTSVLEGDCNYELSVIDSANKRHCYMDGIMPFVDWT